MNKAAYEAYLQSEQWQSLRVQVLTNAGYRCQVCNNPDGLDVHHRTYERAGNEQLGDLIALCDRCHTMFHEQGASRPSCTIHEAISSAYAELDERKAKGQAGLAGLPTGFIDLDKLTAGLCGGHLIIVGSASGEGKSAFVQNMALQIGCQVPTLFVSLEASRVELAERFLAILGGVDGHRLRLGRLEDDEVDILVSAGEVLREAPLLLLTQHTGLAPIVASIRDLKAKHGLRAVFLDCIDLVEASHGRPVSRRLRQLAMELHLPIVATARVRKEQPDRQDHRPRLADLRRTSEAESDADTIIFLHRPEYHEPGQHEGVIELIVAKNRNGPTGESMLLFDKKSLRFANFAVEHAGAFPDGL